MSGEMAQIPDQSPGLIKTGKMFSSVGSEADIFSSSAEETEPEMQRQASKTQLVFGRSNCKSSITVCKSFTNNVWKDITSGVEEENLAVNVKGTVSWERKAVENDDVSSSYAFERNPLDLRLEKEKNASKTLSCELKVENPGGEEEDGCSHEEVNPSSGAESSVQESQGVSKHGCDLLSSAGINNSGASSAPRDNKDDQFLGKDVQKVNHIEDFNLLTVLGEGSFGKVLLCELRETKQVYAIKALKKDVVLEDDDVECTMVERRVLALATRHPFLTHLHSTFQTQGHLFFVMEYVIGGNLSFLIQRVGKFEEIQARFYAAETVCGLEFLHDRGIIYRDLKLDNVLLDADGHIKLADFGMCKEGIAESKKASTFCGTDDYIAPEILQRRQYDAAADWWSFGVLLYKMLTGQFPFAGEGREELFYSICRDKVHYPEEISSNAEDCLCQLFQRTPVERLAYKKGRKPNIRGHKFFDRLDWTKLEQRKVQPPFKPEVTSDRDTSNFDPDFTTEVPQFTPTDKDLLQSMDQGQFKGFSFVNPYSGSQQ